METPQCGKHNISFDKELKCVPWGTILCCHVGLDLQCLVAPFHLLIIVKLDHAELAY